MILGNKVPNEEASSVSPSSTIKSARAYIHQVTKAVTHPIRSQILQALKEGSKSTIDLEQITGETRYNLYHHLHALEEAGLVASMMRDNKTKLYSLRIPQNPQAAVIEVTEEDIQKKALKFKEFLNALSELEGEPIPFAGKITKAEIFLYYAKDEETE